MEDLKRMAGGASALFNRAVQFTGEKLGTAEHTELDAHFDQLISRAEKTKLQTERLLKFTETLLHPDPTERAEDFIYDQLGKTGLNTKKAEKLPNLTVLGSVMLEASAAYGPGSVYGNNLLKVGQTEQLLGQCEADFISKSTEQYLKPLKAYLDGDMKTIAKERRTLEIKRLDLDAAKSKLKRAKSEKARGDAESELRLAQSEFDRQAEVTRLLLEGVSSAHSHHSSRLRDFVDAQAAYYASCHQYMTELQRQLGGNSDAIGGGNKPSSNHSSNFSSTQLTALASRDYKSSSSAGFSALCDDPHPQKARVLYDYDAAKPNELSLIADEIIAVWPIDDPEWMMGQRGTQQGRVPITYIEIIRL